MAKFREGTILVGRRNERGIKVVGPIYSLDYFQLAKQHQFIFPRAKNVYNDQVATLIIIPNELKQRCPRRKDD